MSLCGEDKFNVSLTTNSGFKTPLDFVVPTITELYYLCRNVCIICYIYVYILDVDHQFQDFIFLVSLNSNDWTLTNLFINKYVVLLFYFIFTTKEITFFILHWWKIKISTIFLNLLSSQTVQLLPFYCYDFVYNKLGDGFMSFYPYSTWYWTSL